MYIFQRLRTSVSCKIVVTILPISKFDISVSKPAAENPVVKRMVIPKYPKAISSENYSKEKANAPGKPGLFVALHRYHSRFITAVHTT